MRGRMGAVYILDEFMKEEQLRALHARGPDYRGFGGSGDGLLDPAWEGSLLPHNRVMLLVHPARLPCSHHEADEEADTMAAVVAANEGGGAVDFESARDWRGRPTLEMVREQQEGRAQAQQLPVALGRGAVAVARTRIVDVLECVGGAKVGTERCESVGLSNGF